MYICDMEVILNDMGKYFLWKSRVKHNEAEIV